MDSKKTVTTVTTEVVIIKNPQLEHMRALEREIEEWRYHNSQSNPGAVMELRAMRKELDALKKELGF